MSTAVPLRGPVPLEPRAAVWYGSGTGTWWVDQYTADRRTPGLRPYERAEVDAAVSSPVRLEEFESWRSAITYAVHAVTAMRMTALILEGTDHDER